MNNRYSSGRRNITTSQQPLPIFLSTSLFHSRNNLAMNPRRKRAPFCSITAQLAVLSCLLSSRGVLGLNIPSRMSSWKPLKHPNMAWFRKQGTGRLQSTPVNEAETKTSTSLFTKDSRMEDLVKAFFDKDSPLEHLLVNLNQTGLDPAEKTEVVSDETTLSIQEKRKIGFLRNRRKDSKKLYAYSRWERGAQLRRACAGEFLGTLLLISLGLGATMPATLLGSPLPAQVGAAVWGLAVAVAIYATSFVSGAHLNPAVTLTLFLFERRTFQWGRAWRYMAAQLAGAACGAAIQLRAYAPLLRAWEAARGVERAGASGALSAALFCCAFPSPGAFGTGAGAAALVSPLGALAVEAWATAVLMFVVRALSDPRNHELPSRQASPVYVAATVGLLGLSYGALTGACMNPARDLGPRLVLALAGWGRTALPGPRGCEAAVYVAGPVLGALAGRAAYDGAFRWLGLEEVTQRINNTTTEDDKDTSAEDNNEGIVKEMVYKGVRD
mmetsp:Transcript_20092/g.34616  ORF Transcript_20092/g.34616 Transcript_20092/m.34616 type:complete len:498 (-) Transcript_20092:95-1588(-)